MVVRVTCSKFFFMAKGLKFVVFEKKKEGKIEKKIVKKEGEKEKRRKKKIKRLKLKICIG